MKKVLFFDPHLNERGTSIATYDYAYYNETILGNKSIIASLTSSELKSYNKFNDRFEVIMCKDTAELSNIECDYMYVLKFGTNDGVLHKDAKNLVHVVFPSYDPHGDVYAYISKWLAEAHGKNSPFVPHMVNLPEVKEDFKDFFKIKDKLVVGWYGGDNFDIPFAQQAVIEAASKRSDIVFLFMNQTAFCDIDNVIFVKGTTDQEQKVAFINTCDVMIHARERGETFGLAVAEFSSKNKPIITYFDSPERNHLVQLRDKGIYYSNYSELLNILLNIQLSDIQHKEWNQYTDFTPEKVINQFNNVFLWN
jgi:glycosyltransferase involved in cell wall biosynthesis